MMDAAAFRTLNHDLDVRILSLVDRLDPAQLHALSPDPVEEWSAAIVLAHLAEFPRFFAGELRRFLADPSAPIGRTHEHPERLLAIEAASGGSLDDLRTAVGAAFADLALALEELTDEHLPMTTNNRRYGDEPLTAFLDRYVTGHKRGHLDQLAAMPAAPATSEDAS
jgi:Mycothiol maleylpyruvate isomerase N-terminal domain